MISLPNTVTAIGYDPFSGCTGLRRPIYNSTMFVKMMPSYIGSYEIPMGIEKIANYAFKDCTALTSVTIPNSVTSIGSQAFYGCSGLTSVTIGNSVTSIGSQAFYGCSGLKSVTIPNSVTSIGTDAFYDCSGLKSVTIPNSVTSIGRYAFAGCSGLTSISVHTDNQYYDSRKNSNAIIEKSTNTLIVGCKNTTIPNSVKSIGDAAFYGCSGLTSVTIPNSVTSIGNWTFANCYGLTSVTIGNSVTSIGHYAFTGCYGLTSVTIGNSVTSIGNTAFYGCSGLTTVTIPNSVSSIGNEAFSHCYGLTSVTIGNSVTSIGDNAFYWCSGLTTVTIPNSVTSIGRYAFENCSSLKSITSLPTIPPSCGSYAFSNSSNVTLYVYAMAEEAYKNANVWKDFTIMTMPDNLEEYTIVDGNELATKDTLTFNKLTYTRTFTDTNWQSLYIPAGMSFSDWEGVCDVADINMFHQYDTDNDGQMDETELEVTIVRNGELQPNTPYLIRAKQTGEYEFTISNGKLYSAAQNSLTCSSTKINYTFTGTYSSLTKDCYIIKGGELTMENASISPMRWYLTADSRGTTTVKMPARISIRETEDYVDGVETVQTSGASVQAIYNLAGQRVTKAQKGIFIQNGKKILK